MWPEIDQHVCLVVQKISITLRGLTRNLLIFCDKHEIGGDAAAKGHGPLDLGMCLKVTAGSGTCGTTPTALVGHLQNALKSPGREQKPNRDPGVSAVGDLAHEERAVDVIGRKRVWALGPALKRC